MLHADDSRAVGAALCNRITQKVVLASCHSADSAQ